ncbi:putative transposase, Ptta/En/Spm, plant [Senna tora]|uniref:Putative transposase, Ptta/En/Spm, plant n=1 Tax=Senna tora TaxID=362788 RepID=A0A834TLK9_9FABA|nr:putative transposase, Ptta/En/Spm, plant [Senna tora]
MEEVNVDELPNPMNAPHTDQFIDDDEETDHNEFLDSDEELFDSDSRVPEADVEVMFQKDPKVEVETGSPLVTTPYASASPIDANNSRDFASPSPELPGASTGHILDSVESTVPHAGVDRRKVITVEENGTRFGPTFVTRSIMSSVFGRMPFAAERWRDYSIEVKEELFKEFMRKSEAAKRSRATAPDAMLHTGGSISFGAYKKKMENLDIALLDKYGEESSSYPEVDANLWLDVAPHSKKGRIHGLGQGLQLSTGSPNSTSSVCSTTSTTTPIIPQSQIDEAVSRAMATMWSTQMAPMLQSFMSQVNQAPTRSSQGEERQSTPANDDNDDVDADADLGV